jgi:hypothetical protein
LGWLGGYVAGDLSERVVWLLLGGISAALALREFGRFQFPVPQCRRQTQKVWGNRFGPATAAWWWGLDLGSGLTTIVTFSGYWLLVLAVLFGSDARYGAAVLGLYGLGRSLSVVLVPLLLDRTSTLLAALQRLRGYRPYLHRWHGYGLLGLALGLTIRGMVLG